MTMIYLTSDSDGIYYKEGHQKYVFKPANHSLDDFRLFSCHTNGTIIDEVKYTGRTYEGMPGRTHRLAKNFHKWVKKINKTKRKKG